MESGMGVRTPRGAIRILALLVDSGMIYILIGVSSTLVYKHGRSQFVFSSGHDLGLYCLFPVHWTLRDFYLIPAPGHTAFSA
jgi:hypothetical protein